ncbi:hypothetical protein M408DRAFT_329704 [Serendipita vermifera MAFF 305830]|uniref:Uncharacterized protein n=1 Tax=Serendipita vermifera MAFF 305830 TaxID=933852 RepID=A0A0C3B9C5_SERVB|nr:hypothetical protein M408DRAFT_329704 [Serendipita vermifera MAFF 305830]
MVPLRSLDHLRMICIDRKHDKKEEATSNDDVTAQFIVGLGERLPQIEKVLLDSEFRVPGDPVPILWERNNLSEGQTSFQKRESLVTYFNLVRDRAAL